MEKFSRNQEPNPFYKEVEKVENDPRIKIVVTPIVERETGILFTEKYPRISSVEAMDFMEKNKGKYLKFASYRSVPFLFGKEYGDLSKEYEVLVKMYAIEKEHVAQPVSIDKNSTYYSTEYYGGAINLSESTLLRQELSKENSQVIQQILRTIEKFHAQGIAHGDILNNVLIYVNEKNIITDWIIIDPVGIDDKDEHFVETKQKDIGNLWQVLTGKFSQKESVKSYEISKETPRAPKRVPTVKIQTDPEKLSPVVSKSLKKVEALLAQKGIVLQPFENIFSMRVGAKVRNETASQYQVAKVELLAKLTEQIADRLNKEPFTEKEHLVFDILSSLPDKDRVLITEDTLSTVVEKIHEYHMYLTNAINFINDLKRYETDAFDEDVYEVSLVGNAVCITFDENIKEDENFPFKERFSKGFAGVAFQHTYKGNEFHVMLIPRVNFAYAVEHETRHATLNKVLFEKFIEDNNDWEDFHLKEEIVAFLSTGHTPKFIEELLADEKAIYKYSNFENFQKSISTLKQLSRVYDNRTLANILSIVPLDQWAKFEKLVFKVKNVADSFTPGPTPRNLPD